MTAVSLGLEMTLESGTLTRPSADARLRKSVRLSSEIAAHPSTRVFVEHTAASATCHGRQRISKEPRETLLTADANDPGENNKQTLDEFEFQTIKRPRAPL